MKRLLCLSWFQLKSQVQNDHITYKVPDKNRAFKKLVAREMKTQLSTHLYPFCINFNEWTTVGINR